MSPSDGALSETIRQYILREFLPGEAPEHLTVSTPLISTGILDSIALLRVVGFLEESFGVTIASAEVNPDHFQTIEAMAALVRGKRPHA